MNQPTHCPNCATELQGEYCSNCGQNQKGIDRFFLSLVNEAFEDIFSWNSRAWRTLVGLLFRPGFLSTEYFAGRRARYIQPIRLYFITSIVFFLLITLLSYMAAAEFKFEPDQVNAADVQAQKEQSEKLGEAIGQDTILSTEQFDDVDEDGGDELKLELATPEAPESSDQDNEVLLDENKISVPFFSEERNARLQKRVGQQKEKLQKLAAEDLSGFMRELLEFAPPLLFILVPLFALLLKIIYVYKRRYYTHHLILAVHNHCFVFALLSFYTAVDLVLADDTWIENIISGVVFLWIPIYLWRSLRKVYGQGVLLTSINFTILGSAYMMLLGFAAILVFIIGMMML